jgi:hypothetical protein
MDITIQEVTGKKQMNAFLDFPYALYKTTLTIFRSFVLMRRLRSTQKKIQLLIFVKPAIGWLFKMEK